MAEGEGFNRLARLFFEAGALKRVPRSGWGAAGVESPESVAEHSFRAATLALFHDLPEARILDLHKVAQRYFDGKSAERRAAQDQVESLPEGPGRLLSMLFTEGMAEESPEARVAKDADLLECLISAAEYRRTGHPVDDWIANAEAGLKTGSARKLASAALSQDPFAWWKGLKKN